MKSFWRAAGLVILVVSLLLVAGVVAAVVNLADIAMSPDLSITVDDETIHFAGLSGAGWLLALGGVLLAVLIVLVVVPLVLLFGLGVPLLLCAGGLVLALLVAGAALVAVASPFIALALLIAWVVRPRRARQPLPLQPAQRLQPDLPSGA